MEIWDERSIALLILWSPQYSTLQFSSIQFCLNRVAASRRTELNWTEMNALISCIFAFRGEKRTSGNNWASFIRLDRISFRSAFFLVAFFWDFLEIKINYWNFFSHAHKNHRIHAINMTFESFLCLAKGKTESLKWSQWPSLNEKQRAQHRNAIWNL